MPTATFTLETALQYLESNPGLTLEQLQDLVREAETNASGTSTLLYNNCVS